MPKLEAKIIQRELEAGTLRPVYWIYGTERMKVRELVKLIRKTAFPGEAVFAGLAEESLDGSVVTGAQVVDAAKSLSLGGGVRLIIVKDAHLVSGPEVIAELFGQSGTRDSLPSVCVCVAKDLDGRKKFSKALVEHAAVIPCEEIAEEERDAWIQYLAKRKNLGLPDEAMVRLRSLDPWSLDIIDNELDKLSLSEGVADSLLMGEGTGAFTADAFLSAFFGRKLKDALAMTASLAESPEEALPFLGLLAWNVRQLVLFVRDRSAVKMNPYVAERFSRWSKQWKLEHLLVLQSELAELDFNLKQTPKLPLGLWSDLVIRFCSK